MSNKIVPLRGHYENFHALLARIAEDDEAIGMAAVLKYRDGSVKDVTFDVTCAEIAFASVMLARTALEGEDD